MKEKEYELKTTTAELESAEFGNYHKDLKKIQHDARLAHELLERVAFLERVAEQAGDSFFVTTIPSSDSELCKQTYNGWRFVGRECIFVHGGTGYGIHSEVSDCPDLAQYLRERESAK